MVSLHLCKEYLIW